MIGWEPDLAGAWECCSGGYYGIVELNRQWQGWRALLVGPNTTEVAPRLYPTSWEARVWVEARLGELVRGQACVALSPQQ
jgi:hypothetical protein